MTEPNKILVLSKGQILLCESKQEDLKDWCIIEVARVGTPTYNPVSSSEQYYADLLNKNSFFARNLASSGSDFLIQGDFEFMVNKELEEVKVTEIDVYTALMIANVKAGVKNTTNWTSFLTERGINEEEEHEPSANNNLDYFFHD